MKRSVIALLLTGLLLLFAGCAKEEPSPEPGPEPGARCTLTVSFDYKKQSGSGSNQFAVWIEDVDGEHIETLYATQFTAAGGYKKRPDSLAVWVERAMGKADFDAVAGATPKSGRVAYTMDFTYIPPGTYRFFVEGTLRMKSYVLFTGELDVCCEETSAEAIPAYFPEGAAEQGMITNVKAEFIP